jgi:hypothetical protein
MLVKNVVPHSSASRQLTMDILLGFVEQESRGKHPVFFPPS